MASTNILKVESRKESGSSAARRLRREGKVPGIIYGPECQPRMIKLQRHEFEMTLRRQRSENVLFDIVVDSEPTRKVLLKDVEHDPLTGQVTHVDFLEISMTTAMRIRVPVVLKGDPVGVTQEGGVLEQVLRDIEVECLPVDLVDYIEADVSGLKLNQAMKLSDLKVPPKLKVLTAQDATVAVVAALKAEEEAPKPEEGAEAAAEPEVIAKGKEEEGEGEGAEAAGGKEKEKEKADKESEKKAAPKEEKAHKEEKAKK